MVDFRNTWHKISRSQFICYEIKLMVMKLSSLIIVTMHSAVSLFAPWLSPYSWSVLPCRNIIKYIPIVHTQERLRIFLYSVCCYLLLV